MCFLNFTHKNLFSNWFFAVHSWGSGTNPWGPEKEDQFARPTHYDGMLEVVGMTGVVHMGQISSGMRSAIRIAQGGHVRRFNLKGKKWM